MKLMSNELRSLLKKRQKLNLVIRSVSNAQSINDRGELLYGFMTNNLLTLVYRGNSPLTIKKNVISNSESAEKKRSNFIIGVRMLKRNNFLAIKCSE